MVSSFAALVLLSGLFRASGVVGNAINTEHFHDLGKLLFGFNCFWAYISFSQFFLIWYASIPEETVFFHLRWSDGPWKSVSLAILFLHFILPFALLVLSAVAKQGGDPKAVLAELRRTINELLDPHERPERLVVVSEEWTVDNGLLTPTLKVKRAAIEARYGHHIQTWYAEAEAILFHQA